MPRGCAAADGRAAKQIAVPVLRSRDEKSIAGVCGGFAEALGWNTALVRNLYVIVSLLSVAFPGGGAHLVLWLIMRGTAGAQRSTGLCWLRAARMRQPTMIATAMGIAYSTIMTPRGTAHRAPWLKARSHTM